MEREIRKYISYAWCNECRDSFPVIDDTLCCPYGHKFTEMKCSSIVDDLEDITTHLECLTQCLRKVIKYE